MTLEEYWERLGAIAGWKYQGKQRVCTGWEVLLAEMDEELWLRNMSLYHEADNEEKIEELHDLAEQLYKEYPELFI